MNIYLHHVVGSTFVLHISSHSLSLSLSPIWILCLCNIYKVHSDIQAFNIRLIIYDIYIYSTIFLWALNSQGTLWYCYVKSQLYSHWELKCVDGTHRYSVGEFMATLLHLMVFVLISWGITITFLRALNALLCLLCSIVSSQWPYRTLWHFFFLCPVTASHLWEGGRVLDWFKWFQNGHWYSQTQTPGYYGHYVTQFTEYPTGQLNGQRYFFVYNFSQPARLA